MRYPGFKRGECSVNVQSNRLAQEARLPYETVRALLRHLLAKGIITNTDLPGLTGEWVRVEAASDFFT